LKSAYYLVLPICLVCVYVLFRSYSIDITHDEAYSFHVMKAFWHVEAFCTANTHWLNSLAIKVAILLHMENNWQIRWLSSLSAIAFFIIVFIWVRSLNNLPLQLFALAIIIFNPFVLDYFSLARGYASGLMLEAFALLLFFISINKENRHIAFCALVCSALSAIANYSFVYFFTGFALVYFYHYYLKKRAGLFKTKGFYIDALLCITTLLLVIRAWIFIIKCSNDVGAGTDSITEVCNSFMEGLFYRRLTFINHSVLLTLSIILIGFITIVCLHGIVRFSKHQNQVYFYSSLILSVVLCAVFTNFICFNTPLPYARSALFMFPLICINIVYFFSSISLKKPIFTALSILLLINFFASANTTHTLDFAAQENTQYVFNYVDRIGARHVAMNQDTYGVYINYYQQTNNMKYRFKGDYVNDIKTPNGYDYVLLSASPAALPPVFDKTKLTLVKRFTGNGITLFKVEE